MRPAIKNIYIYFSFWRIHPSAFLIITIILIIINQNGNLMRALFLFLIFICWHISTADICTVVELRVFDVHEILFGRCGASVPGTWVITPLDARIVFSLSSVITLLHQPVHPEALGRAVDHAGDGGAGGDLRDRRDGKFVTTSDASCCGSLRAIRKWSFWCGKCKL